MGREHARLCAAEGASVVVNDRGCDRDGTGLDPAVADAVVKEIVAAGGTAVASSEDVATMDGAQRVLDQAVRSFGRLDALINNAGILRDRMFVNMSEDEWDSCIRGHLKATFCPTRVAAAYWRDCFKAGEPIQAAVLSTSSTSGLIGQAGQSNYGAAKAGIAAMTVILADELKRYGVRANAITPVARTRMTEETPGVADLVRRPDDPAAFDVYHPGNVSPLVAWLVSADCPVTGRVFYVKGGEVRQFLPWHYGEQIDGGDRWDVSDLAKAMTRLL
jgi:NAD(P)-dependent dehydrogenase (short-subunit alcohol dehydrogenase family)